MRILVTGHDGYLGTVLAPMLRGEGHEVVGLDSFLLRGCTFGREPDPEPALRRDIRDVRPSDLVGFEAVVHLAGLCNDPLGDLDPTCTFDINHLASVRLAGAAREAGVERFVFSSSCSVYGAATDGMVTEESEPRPLSPYGLSKVRAERDIGRLADRRFSPTFLRNPTAYGVSPRLRADLVVNNLVGYAFTTGSVLIKSDGTPWRPLAHVEDIARAFLAVLHAPRDRVHNEVFNVGATGENYRIREVADIVASVVPGSEVRYASDAGPDRRSYRVSCDKLPERCPDFRPSWTVERGVGELYEACLRHGLSPEDFLGPRLMRIDHIKRLLAEGRLDHTLRWRPAAAARPPGARDG